VQLLSSESVAGTLDFYLKAKHIRDEPKDSWGKALAQTQNYLPPKKIRFGQEFGQIDRLDLFVRSILVKEEYSYIIPITSVGGIVRGFIFRLVERKEFRRVDDGRPLFYGFHRFKDFKYGQLIIVSEGIKDAEAVARFYPYSLSIMGNHISEEQAEILKRLTSKLVFIGDNDERSRKVERLNKKAGAIVLYPPVKDVGMYFESQESLIGMYLKNLVGIYSKGGRYGKD